MQRCLSTALAAAFLSVAAVGAEGNDRPNFVVFLSDDHSQLDSTPYGATDVRTPNMQALAEAGCRFNDAFVATPSCAEPRGLADRADAGAQRGRIQPQVQEGGHPLAPRGAPRARVRDGRLRESRPRAERRRPARVRSHRPAPDAPVVAEFLATRDKTKPLCLFVGTHEPHVPWPDNDGYRPDELKVPPTHVDTPETRDFRARYYTDVTKADTLLGEVRQLTRETFGENALFLYTSDHGAQWPFAKWNLYDVGIRVPLLVEWPGVIKPGSTSDAMVQWIDLIPTLIDIAGGQVPPNIDGRSFADVLRGKSDEHRDRIFTTHANDGDMNVYPIRSVRTRRFKYIRNLHPEFEHTTHIDRALARDGGYYWKSWEKAAKTDPAAAAVVKRYHQRPAEELYDLEADPREQVNLADDPKYAETLESLARSWTTG